MCSTCNLECSRSGNDAFVDDHIVDTSQAVPHSIGDLGYSVGIGSFNQKCNRLWVLDVFLEIMLEDLLMSEF